MNVRKLELETLLNNTSDEDVSDDWLVYGHSDLLHTSLIYSNEDSNTVGGSNELECIYKDSIELSDKLKQIFYLFCKKDDKDFIEESKNNNFLAIFFITLNYERSSIGFGKIIDAFPNKESHTLFVYETLDNYDLVILSYGNSTKDIETNFYEYINQGIENSKLGISIRDIYKMYTTYYGRINHENKQKEPTNHRLRDLNINLHIENSKERHNKFAFSYIFKGEYKEYLSTRKSQQRKDIGIGIGDAQGGKTTILLSLKSIEDKVEVVIDKAENPSVSDFLEKNETYGESMGNYNISLKLVEEKKNENSSEGLSIGKSMNYMENINIQLSIKNGKNQNYILDEIRKTIKDENLKLSYINGSNDLSVSVEGICMNELFSLYKTTKENEGIFAINSKFREQYIALSNLKFFMTIPNESYKYFNKQSLSITPNFQKFINNIDFSSIKIGSLYRVELNRMVNSMLNSLKLSLSDYSFLSLYLGIKKFLQKITLTDEEYDLSRSTRYFLESCNAIINTSSAIQIGYYPKQEYVNKEVIAPSELMCFYSAFTWKMVETVIKVEKDSNPLKKWEFTFCLTPSIKENVAVKALFMNDNEINDRLLLVEVPIKNVYRPEVMLFSLCHEASHYVGEKVRMRDKRMNYIYKAYISYLMDTIQTDVNTDVLEEYSIQKNMEKLFKGYVENISKKYSLRSYSLNLKKILNEATYCLLSDLTFSISGFYRQAVGGKCTVKESNMVINAFKKLRLNVQEELMSGIYEEKIECIIEVFSESYADLFAILYLDIDKAGYEKCITKAGDMDSLNAIDSDYISIRLLANFYANKFDTGDLVGKMKYQKEIYESYIASKKESSGKILSTVFENPEMLKQLIIYLKACKKSFNRYYLNNRKAKHKLDENRQIKGLFNMNLDLATIYDYNKEFRDYIFKDIINSYPTKDK